MDGTETFDWPVGERLGWLVRVGRDTFLRPTYDSDGMPDVGVEELERQARSYMARQTNNARNRLTTRREPD